MIYTRIYDSLFPSQASPTALGDNEDRKPLYMAWDRTQVPPVGSHVWLTDSDLSRAPGLKAAGYLPVGWILEGRSLRSDPYDYVEAHNDAFEAIVTRDSVTLTLPNAVEYIRGGTRIAPGEWRRDNDLKNYDNNESEVSIVASDKHTTVGHQMRHRLIEHFGDRIDAYGPSYVPLPEGRKVHALAPYKFSLAIESGQNEGITEHLIDCLLTGTVPIYYGAPTHVLFDAFGIIQVSSFEQAVQRIGEVLEEPQANYYDRIYAIERNFMAAHDFTLVEDWLYRRYPELFT